MKTIVFFDVDGTLIRGNVNAITYFYLLRQKLFSPLFVMHAAFWAFIWRLGIYDNLGGVAQGAARELGGMSEGDIQATVDRVFRAAIVQRLYKQAQDIIRKHIQDGHDVVLLSGSFEPFIRPIGHALGVKSIIGTRLEAQDSRYTGNIAGPIVGLHKSDIVARYIAEHGYAEAYAYSDHYRDVPMLEVVDHAIAVNPDMWLARAARKRGWKILRFR